MKVTVFRLDNCPNCDKLEQMLHDMEIPFTEVNLENTRAPEMIEMRMKGHFPMEAPVLRVGCCYLFQPHIFAPSGTELSEQALNMFAPGI